jgi:hypothetical protein
MLTNFLLFLITLIMCIVLYRQFKIQTVDQLILPDCKFTITKPKFEINESIRIAKYSVITRNKNRYFKDFPIGFKFYSNQKFRSKIKITYVISGDDEIEIIYDRIVEFDDNAKEHTYYINDVIVGSIDIEIYTDSYYGKPTIEFEILQNNMCHMSKEHKIKIEFPS